MDKYIVKVYDKSYRSKDRELIISVKFNTFEAARYCAKDYLNKGYSDICIGVKSTSSLVDELNRRVSNLDYLNTIKQ